MTQSEAVEWIKLGVTPKLVEGVPFHNPLYMGIWDGHVKVMVAPPEIIRALAARWGIVG